MLFSNSAFCRESSRLLDNGDTPWKKSTIKLGISETVKLAVTGNRDIQIATFYPAIATEELKSSQSVYDPALFAENNIIRTERPIQSILDNGTAGEEIFSEHRWDARAGVKQPLPTGGIASVYVDVDHLNSSSDLVIPNPQYTSRLTFQVRQALLKEFFDRSNRSAIEIADINLDIANAEFHKIFSGTIKDVASSYWLFAYYYKQLDISRSAVVDAEDISNRIRVRNEKGLSGQLDVDRAISAVQDRKRRLIADRIKYETTMDQLKLLVGMSPSSPDFRADIIPVEELKAYGIALDKSMIVQEALKLRPEYLVADKKMKAAKIRKKLAQHQKLPKLDAKASYSFNSLGSDFNESFDDTYLSDEASWAVGLEFEWPIGGRKSAAQYRKMVYEYEQSQAELNKTIEQITYEINSAINEIEQTWDEIDAAGEARDAYSRVLEREETRFEMAKINNQGLLDAQDDFYESERNRVRALLNFNLSLLKLKWAKGSLAEDFGVKQES